MRMSEVAGKHSQIKTTIDYIRNKDYGTTIDYIRNKDYGTTIEFMELQPFTKYNLSDELELYLFKTNIIAKVKKELIKYGIILKSVKYIGYYILKPNQISSWTYRTYIRKPLKAFEKAKLILENVDKKELNQKESDEHKLIYDLNNELINANINILENERYINLYNGSEK